MSTTHCSLCEGEGDQPKVFAKVDGAIFFQCSTCGFVWLEEGKWPKNQQAYYSEQYYLEGYAGRKNLKNLFQYRFVPIKQYFKPHGKVLEVGAASGDFLHLLQDVGYDVSGVELSKRAALQASRNYGLELFQGTLQEAAFPDDTFDYVVMYHVLEHIPDPLATLKEVRRILKPGGRILIEVPNIQSIDVFSRALLLNILDYPNHLYAFSPSTLARIVRTAGFKLVSFEPSFPFLIAQYLGKLRAFFTRHSSPMEKPQLKDMEEEEVSGKEFLIHAAQSSLLKRSIARILPGMKMTILAQK